MAKAESKIDRRKLTPSLIRVFVRIGSHHNDKAYADPHNLPSGEMHIHTWKDESLDVLTTLLSTAKAEIRKNKNVVISYALVYPDRCGRMVVKKLGIVEKGSQSGNDDRHKTLEELKFEVGDYLDVAIKLPPRNSGTGLGGTSMMDHSHPHHNTHPHSGGMDTDRINGGVHHSTIGDGGGGMDMNGRESFRNGRNVNIRGRGDRDRMRDRERQSSVDRDRDRDRDRREFTTRRGERRDFYRGRGFRGSFRGRR